MQQAACSGQHAVGSMQQAVGDLQQVTSYELLIVDSLSMAGRWPPAAALATPF